jgi:hypothetical protein
MIQSCLGGDYECLAVSSTLPNPKKSSSSNQCNTLLMLLVRQGTVDHVTSIKVLKDIVHLAYYIIYFKVHQSSSQTTQFKSHWIEGKDQGSQG